jgi:hypothetical protein
VPSGERSANAPVADATRGPPGGEKRLFRVSVVGLPAQHAQRVTVWAGFLRRRGIERR